MVMSLAEHERSNAFWRWSKQLDELISVAREADPATAEMTTSPNWLDVFKRDLQDIGNHTCDAAPDDVTTNQVIRSCSLALQLVRMLHEWPDINCTPCRKWSPVDQQVVNDLAELQSQFAKLGDGKGPQASVELHGLLNDKHNDSAKAPLLKEMRKKRNDQIKILCKTHKLRGKWAKLTALAKSDPVITQTRLKVTRYIVRNVIEPPHLRRKK